MPEKKAIPESEQREATGSYKDVLRDPEVLFIILGFAMYIVLVAVLVPMGNPWKLGGVIILTLATGIFLTVSGIRAYLRWRKKKAS